MGWFDGFKVGAAGILDAGTDWLREHPTIANATLLAPLEYLDPSGTLAADVAADAAANDALNAGAGVDTAERIRDQMRTRYEGMEADPGGNILGRAADATVEQAPAAALEAAGDAAAAIVTQGAKAAEPALPLIGGLARALAWLAIPAAAILFGVWAIRTGWKPKRGR